MANTYWLKQSEPLFEDLLWSRPENKASAGKLLIVGGNLHGFSVPAEAYSFAVKAGIGTARILLPNALQKTIGKFLENGQYAPSTPSGSFAKLALAELIEQELWADCVLLAGDFGRNSETAVLLESFLNKSLDRLVITDDAVDYFFANPELLLQRDNTTLVLNMHQLQKLAIGARFSQAFTLSMDLVRLVDALHDFSSICKVNIVVKHLGNIVNATSGNVSSTKLNNDKDDWQIKTASYASVWLIQNPTKHFEALTTAVYKTTE